MRKGVGRYAMAIAALAWAGCGADQADDRSEFEEPPPPPPTVTTEEAAPGDAANVVRTAVFGPVGDAEFALRGTARLISADEVARAFRIAIDLQDVPEGEHPWTLRRGSCEEVDSEVVVPFATAGGQSDVAEPLRPDAAGHVQTVVDVPEDLLTLDELNDGEFSLVVHSHLEGERASPMAMACADLGR